MCGLMIAYLNKAGTLPVFRDVFRIAIMIGSSSGMHCFSNQVRMGSSAQDELDADSIVLCISSEVANLRQSSLIIIIIIFIYSLISTKCSVDYDITHI